MGPPEGESSEPVWVVLEGDRQQLEIRMQPITEVITVDEVVVIVTDSSPSGEVVRSIKTLPSTPRVTAPITEVPSILSALEKRHAHHPDKMDFLREKSL
ncbi:hypothetical protein [Natrinema altunense]|uniref:hypothetical protein n=1 Tax=Natrinema altunense TaxID=222984 RepID=UPI000678C5B7|nr:hypothetical protein [Natrinema altunense]